MKTALALIGVLLAACGTQQVSDPVRARPGDAGPMPTAIPAAAGEVTSWLATVMDTGRPELCLGGVDESYPPQCSGVPLQGWDWSDHQDMFEQAGDTRWGEFAVTGRFDGETFKVTGAIAAALWDPAAPDAPVDLSTPCPEPDGGWVVPDPDRTTADTMEQAFRTASHLDGYAGAWLDQSLNPARGADNAEERMNDPLLSIVNVKVTGDKAVAERALRAVWGGMLCVSGAEHTEAELRDIQQQVNELPGMLSSYGQFDVVSVQVVYDDGSLQSWADATYGEGLVRIESALHLLTE